MTFPKTCGLLITSTSAFTMVTEWLLLYYVKLLVKYTKIKIGELHDYEVPCDCVTKFIKTNFLSDFNGNKTEARFGFCYQSFLKLQRVRRKRNKKA